jgi:hypothetical protein
MEQYQINADTIAALAGLALAVALRYVPQIAGGWDALDRYAKMLVLATLCLVVAIALAVAQCGPDSVCVNASAPLALRAALTAFVSSQAGYLMVRKSSAE